MVILLMIGGSKLVLLHLIVSYEYAFLLMSLCFGLFKTFTHVD